ncbi:hypothetical protein [Amorphus coralli]|uniref:hypothetical protein n=1 Tax=Amorphus coralli TaxID=340680 RepID=UPI00035D5EA6|nr:hypothetical protein [Amorphus coralli]
MTRLLAICTAFMLAGGVQSAMAEYALKPPVDTDNRMYPAGSSQPVQNAAPWGYSAMAVGAGGRSWIIAARTEAEARSTAQAECRQFDDTCSTVVTGTDSGFFVGGYCGDTPKVAYSPTDFMDAQARFYGNTVPAASGLIEESGDCKLLWLGHRVSPSWGDRPTSLAQR